MGLPCVVPIPVGDPSVGEFSVIMAADMHVLLSPRLGQAME